VWVFCVFFFELWFCFWGGLRVVGLFCVLFVLVWMDVCFLGGFVVMLFLFLVGSVWFCVFWFFAVFVVSCFVFWVFVFGRAGWGGCLLILVLVFLLVGVFFWVGCVFWFFFQVGG